jgi:O-antigen/teichoic acid export membrane protein
MQKKFITNLALLLVMNLLVKPFWIFGIERSVQNVVGAEAFGFYYALFNFSFLFNILLDCGITSFNNKNISQNEQLLNKHLSGIIVLRLVLAALYISVSIIVGLTIGYTALQMKFLLLLCLNQVLISFILYLRSNIAGLHLFRTDSFISVLDRIVIIAICSVLLWGGIMNTPFRIEWFIYAQTASYLITLLITLCIVVRKAELKKLSISMAFFLMILKKSYPYAILVLLMTFYNRIDSVMLERMLPDGSLYSGIYASAYRILDAVNMIAFLFAGLLLPMFSRMIKNKEPVEQLARLAFSLLVVPAAALSVTSSFYSDPIMSALYTAHLEEASAIHRVLIFCFIPISTTYIFGTLLTANGNMRELNIMACTGMLVNIGLNTAFIPVHKALGAAYSSLATQLITAAVQVLIVQYRFRFRIHYSFLLRLLLYVPACLIINGCMLQFTGMEWTTRSLTALAACLILAFVLRLISVRGLFNILRHG